MEFKQIDLKKILAVPDPDKLITATEDRLIPARNLVRTTEKYEDDNELTYIIRYYLKGKIVHRSVHIQLKRPNVVALAKVASF